MYLPGWSACARNFCDLGIPKYCRVSILTSLRHGGLSPSIGRCFGTTGAIMLGQYSFDESRTRVAPVMTDPCSPGVKHSIVLLTLG
jgi:hypothetical protein